MSFTLDAVWGIGGEGGREGGTGGSRVLRRLLQ